MAGDLSQAVESFQLLVADYEMRPAAWIALAACQRDAQDVRSALNTLEEASARFPHSIEVARALCAALLRMERFDDPAFSALPRVPRSEAEWKGYVTLAARYLGKGESAVAESMFSRGVRNCPYEPCRSYLRFGASSSRLHQRRYAGLEEELRSLLQEAPANLDEGVAGAVLASRVLVQQLTGEATDPAELDRLSYGVRTGDLASIARALESNYFVRGQVDHQTAILSQTRVLIACVTRSDDEIAETFPHEFR
jgi:tetratricopeptide (TPR) repeat protein